ncbi:hypothetical protein SAMN06295912_12630 [Sphingomonas laterariae]|uniref:Uncharacterized protein n=1 Tax=Edaphosphingomonas laterariae TaxID=861865 RepID=A0A239IRK6_9SPHN|nr:hypothetical protein [Sphingomonas laterariae]SNS95713.1 hypothetical protein SAMN06295912_12630 [Sphingomonas laterariae]
MEEIDLRIAGAIAAQGRRQDQAPSAEILTLLSELADEGRIADLSIAFSAFARAHPANAPHVLGQIAAKVVNRYYYLRLKLPRKAIERWQIDHPDWADTFRDHINDSSGFVAVVENGAALIRRLDR